MEVGTLRRRAAKFTQHRGLAEHGIRTNYQNEEDSDVDFISKDGLLAWVPSSKKDSFDVLASMTYSDEATEKDKAVIRGFAMDDPVPEPKPNVVATKCPMLLSINREGEFIAQDDSATDNQCGATGARRYRYFVTIQANNDHLTKEGYVMENLWVAEYFKKRYEVDGDKCASCEDMAQTAVIYFLNLFKLKDELKGVEPVRIYVRIHGSDVSFIEAEWKA